MLRNENFMEYGTFRVKTPDKQITQIIFGEFELKPYFCSNKSHHASQRCVPRWDFAFYMVYELRQTTDKYRWTISLASKQRTDNWRYCNSQTTTSQYQLFSGCQLSQIHRARPTASSLQTGQYIRTSHQPLSLWQRTPPTIKLYHQLCTLLYLEQTITPCMDLKSSLLKLFAEHPNVDLHAMGFPQGWENEPLWR